MKLWLLIRSRIRQYWVSNRTIFVLFLIGGIISSVMFCYFYGNMLGYMGYRTSDDDRAYGIHNIYYETLSEEAIMEVYEKIDRIYASDLIQRVRVFHWFSEYPNGEDTVEGGVPMGIIGIGADLSGQLSFRVMVGHSDFESDPDGIVYPDGAGKTVGDTIVIGGKTLTGIGKHTTGEYYVSYETLREMKLPIGHIYITAVRRQDPDNDAVRAFLEELFPDCYVESGFSGQTQANQQSVLVLSLICAVYGASMLSYMFLLRFLMDANVNHTVISRVVGAGKWQILGICFGEAIALCATVDLLGIGIHCLLYDSVFSKLNKQAELVYLSQDYLYIFLVMLATGMIVALCFVIKYASLSPAASRRHAE